MTKKTKKGNVAKTARDKMLDKLRESWLFKSDAAVMRCHLPPKEEIVKELDLCTGAFGTTPERVPDAFRIPYFDFDGSLLGFHRDRLLEIYIPKNKKKAQKYTQQKGASPRLYVCPLLKDVAWEDVADNPDIDLWIVEGELKSAAMCKIGFPCIGIGGVRNWTKKGRGELIHDFDLFDLTRRTIRICFDSDYADNADIRGAFYALSAKLRDRDAKVFRIKLPRKLEA